MRLDRGEKFAYETIWNEFLVSFVASWFVHDQSTGGKGAFGTAPFGVSMMSSEEELQKRVERLFPSVDLFVYQNMDLVPSFYAGKTYTYAYGREYPEKGKVGAAPRIRQMRKASNGRIISFVAWNPFRTQNSTGISSLDLIKREISKGASGVKFYPPLGYRPAGNDFTQYQKPFFFSEARDQWENRYLGNKANQKGKQEADMLKERAKEVDRLNDELFTWCEKKDIPVFTHCSTGEFRAFYTDEYAENANPKYWEFVLMKHPKLRLCFGHAGGVTDWYSGCVAPIGNVKSAKNWGEAVRYFCMKYPNVYCEFGCHDDVAKPEQAEHLYYNLLTYLPQKEPGPWSLADKVMYGSDFSMPIATPAQDYLESFERLFSLPGMRQYKARFFAGNAMKYLKRKVSDRYP